MKTIAKKIVKMFTAWSFSRLSDHEQCPAKAKYKHLDKLPEPSNPHAAHGTAVHTQADQYISGNLKKLPGDFKHFKAQFAQLRGLKAKCEQEWAFTVQWKRVDWFARDAWLRVKVDCHYVTSEQGKTVNKVRMARNVVTIIDFKTGKMYEAEHAAQRSLYAVAAAHVYPDAEIIVVQHWYLDHNHIEEEQFTAKRIEALKKQWASRAAPMLNDKKFPPRPGPYCRWCPYRKANSGPCRY